jgi:hypothetical protein
MNNIFMGSYTTHGAIYDYSGIWSRRGGRVEWKAVVRNADVVCRPAGTFRAEPAESDLVPLLERLIERDIERWLGRR